MLWREFGEKGDAGGPRGLEARLEAADLPARRPGWRVEVAGRQLLRISAGGAPRLWLCGDWYGEAFLVLRAAPLEERGPSPLPPIRFDEVRAVREAPGTPAWALAWSRWFAQRLLASESGPLYAGLWQLRRCAPTRPAAETYFSSPPLLPAGSWNLSIAPRLPREDLLREPVFECGVYHQEIVPLRPVSPDDDGRVHAWRKHARDGSLPPLLAMPDTHAGQCFLLDGHDRLLAALLEGVAPSVLALVPIREEPRPRTNVEGASASLERLLTDPTTAPATIASANRAYAQVHEPQYERYALTRGYAVPGGRAAWEREFGDRLEALGYSARRFFAESRFDGGRYDPRLVRRGPARDDAQR